uniref:Putative secreted protein n=1 Tax=Amblyomma americanum TaxID=6943 RepID=A0A0C9SCT6_AMBAM
MIIYLLALPLFVVALGDDPRCQERYLVDDHCDSGPGEREFLYTYDKQTEKCVGAESCGPETRRLLFSTQEECIKKCNVKGQEIEDVEVPLEDRQIEKERK